MRRHPSTFALLAAATALLAGAAAAQPQAKAGTEAEIERHERLLVSKPARTAYLAGLAEAERPRAALELAAEVAARARAVESGERKLDEVHVEPSGPTSTYSTDFYDSPGETDVRRLYGEAVVLYAEAATTGTPRQAAYAYNEIGNLHLTMGDARQAAAAFSQVDLDAVPEGQRFVYRFNRGRALEQTGESRRAWSDYLAVLDERPAFRPAVDAAWRTLAAAPADDRGAAERAERLADLLLDQGQHDALAEVLWPALERWKSPGLFALLAEWWSAAPPGEGALPAARVAGLRRLRAPLADELVEAFDAAPFERAAQAARGGSLRRLRHLARERFPSWRDVGRGPALSALLTRLAADDHRRGELDAALARTFVAWWLDRANTQAAVDCAAVLSARPALDPNGEILAELVDLVVVAKGGAYATRDWKNALRMHLLLAGIFEEQGVWGSSHELRSVVFQLEHALAAEERIRESDPGYVASPGLHRRLGVAYGEVGDEERACVHYRLAASALAERGRDEEAAKLRVLCGNASATTPSDASPVILAAVRRPSRSASPPPSANTRR